MCDLPIEIIDEEKIVRAVMCPSHLKKDKKTLKPAAFRSKAGTDEVSVIRLTHMGSDFCKAKAKEIAGGSAVIEYAGLAVLAAGQIRSSGSAIQDSREEFCGHAHISHGFILQADEPPGSADNLAVTERCRTLITLATYHADPAPDVSGWTGSQI